VAKSTLDSDRSRVERESKSALEEVLRKGAQRLLGEAIEAEVTEYIERHQHLVDARGRRLVVRNGHLPERELMTGIGSIPVEQPRVNDRRRGEKFSSKVLPPYMRRVPSLDALIPALYLKGISTGDFTEALSAILGKNAAGLSPTNIVRLKESWR
jgi:putative transposase